MSLRKLDLYLVHLRDHRGQESDHLVAGDLEAIWEHMEQFGEYEADEEFEIAVDSSYYCTVQEWYETKEEKKARLKEEKWKSGLFSWGLGYELERADSA